MKLLSGVLLLAMAQLLGSMGSAQLVALPGWHDDPAKLYPYPPLSLDPLPPSPADPDLDFDHPQGLIYDAPWYSSEVEVQKFKVQRFFASGVLAVEDQQGLPIGGYETGLERTYFLQSVGRFGKFPGEDPTFQEYGFICGGVTANGQSRVVTVRCGSFHSQPASWWTSVSVPDSLPSERWVVGDVVEGDLYVLEANTESVWKYEDTDGDYWPDAVASAVPLFLGASDSHVVGVNGFTASGHVVQVQSSDPYLSWFGPSCFYENPAGALQFCSNDSGRSFQWSPQVTGHEIREGLTHLRVRYKPEVAVEVRVASNHRVIGAGSVQADEAFCDITLSEKLSSASAVEIVAKDGSTSAVMTPSVAGVQLFTGEPPVSRSEQDVLFPGYFFQGDDIELEGRVEDGSWSSLPFQFVDSGSLLTKAPKNTSGEAKRWLVRLKVTAGSPLDRTMGAGPREALRSMLVYP